MTKKASMVLVFLLVSITTIGCFSHVARYDGSFKGRVVDAETGGPIEGVVVLGVWYTDRHTISGRKGNFYDAREVVTDKDGNFTMPGKGPRVLSNLRPVHLKIFKAGYSYTGGTEYSFRNSDTGEIKWEGSRAIIPLKNLTMGERWKHRSPNRPDIPMEKMNLMTNEINKDRLERGLNPL